LTPWLPTTRSIIRGAPRLPRFILPHISSDLPTAHIIPSFFFFFQRKSAAYILGEEKDPKTFATLIPLSIRIICLDSVSQLPDTNISVATSLYQKEVISLREMIGLRTWDDLDYHQYSCHASSTIILLNSDPSISQPTELLNHK